MNDQPTISGLTPEQYKLALRLEEIFMPEARRQRIRANFGEESTGESIRFVHYTSADAALKIIKNKRMWMRNTTCMTDYREVQHGMELLYKFFADASRKDAFISALDACHQGAVSEAVNLFDRSTANILFHTYVTSISEHDDKEDIQGRLSMWRAFGGGSTRVAIVFRVPRFTSGSLALNLLFSPVAYLTETEVQSVMQEVIQNIKNNLEFLRTVERPIIVQIIFGMFQAAVVCLKHEGFREEREWRAIYSPMIRPSPLMESSIEVIGGVPQTVYQIPLDQTKSSVLADIDFARLFDRLIIGPTVYPLAIGEAFVSALRAINVDSPHTRVFASNIPIRAQYA
jgi:hypothetical protein